MKEDRKLGFLESLAISAAAGAASGGLCGVSDVSEEKKKQFTNIVIDFALNGAQKLKEREKKGYINPGW